MDDLDPGRPGPLDERLCFALYAASRAMIGAYRPMLDRLGLTYPQFLVMTVLWERRATTVMALATALRLTTGTLSPLLKRIEAAGLITRTRMLADERAVQVALTDAGRDLQLTANELGAVNTAMLVGDPETASVAELAALCRDLEQLTARLDQSAP